MKSLKKSLMLQLKLSFEELVDLVLHLKAVKKERENGNEIEVRKNPNKKKFQFHRSKSFLQTRSLLVPILSLVEHLLLRRGVSTVDHLII